MEHGLVAAIHPPGSGQELPGAGGDRLLARLVTAGACPITLVEDTSADGNGCRSTVTRGTS